MCVCNLSAVLPTPRFTRAIGLLWICLPRVKIVLGGWSKIGLLWRLSARGSFFPLNFPISCQFRLILNLFKFEEQFFHQLIGLRCQREPLTSIISNFRKRIILWISSPIGWFLPLFAFNAPKMRKLGAFWPDKKLGYFQSVAAGIFLHSAAV